MIKLSLPLRLVISAVLNTFLAYALDLYFPQYVTIFGGLGAFVIIGCLLTLMNFVFRPILAIVTFPLHLLFTFITLLIVNGLFLYAVYWITLQMDPNIIALTITGGIAGWIIVACILGTANWVIKHVLRPK